MVCGVLSWYAQMMPGQFAGKLWYGRGIGVGTQGALQDACPCQEASKNIGLTSDLRKKELEVDQVVSRKTIYPSATVVFCVSAN
jgi:hypothetical protein